MDKCVQYQNKTKEKNCNYSVRLNVVFKVD